MATFSNMRMSQPLNSRMSKKHRLTPFRSEDAWERIHQTVSGPTSGDDLEIGLEGCNAFADESDRDEVARRLA